MHRKTLWKSLAGCAALTLTACAAWLGEVPTVAPLPTLTPSPVMTDTPALGVADDGAAALLAETPTPTTTLTATPALTPTPPLGATTTLDVALLLTPGMGEGTARAPSIGYFVASPEEVAPGESVLLIWSSSNGTEAAVFHIREDGTPGRTWAVQTEGSLTVNAGQGVRSEIYVLTVTNGIVTVERELRIRVICPFGWFFAPAPPDDLCPEGEPGQSQATTQEFERGRMFWIAATGQIIVLFDDFPTQGSAAQPAWMMGTSTYQEGEPEVDESIVPPEGLRQPRRGFGSVWRNTPSVRDRLGWAVEDEAQYVTTYQTARVEGASQMYFANRLGEAVALIPEGQGWLVVGFEQASSPP